MNRERRPSSNDPTAEPAVGQSTQSASGLSSGRGPGVERDPAPDEALTNRDDRETPRRYDQPLEDDDDPVMP